MSGMQAQVNEAGRKSIQEMCGKELPVSETNQEQQQKAAEPSSDFPEPAVDSPQEQQAIRDFQGPAGTGQAMKTGDQMAIRPPVAGKSGEGDMRGDMVGGVNRHVGDFISGVGDTEAGRKGTGGVDFSNTAGMP